MADEAGGDADEFVAQGGDHGLAVADAVAGELPVGLAGGGELVQPAGEEGAPHPGCGRRLAAHLRNDGSVGRGRWWSGWSWRARVGWFLLGWVLIVVAVALPVWALTGGDLNKVARWANVLALPVTVVGLVLVVADRARAQAVAGRGDGRCPWMAPPLDRMVPRPELGGRLVVAVTAPGVAEVGLTTALHGAGGFGKTRLATWLCHRPEIKRRFSGGLLWVTVGQEVRGADLAERINDLAFALCGQRPAISDPDAAGAELGRLLDQRGPVLLVIDDVWEQSQLRPFRIGGQACTRLVTTRIPNLLPEGGPRIQVDAMLSDQARDLIADGVVGLPVEVADRLATLAGRWPVLLNLINGVLRRRVAHGQPPQDAGEQIARELAVRGPAAFDPARPGDRRQAVVVTVEASLALLDPADRQRYLDLAIFPEDVDIPLDVLRLLWPGYRVDVFSEELVGLGLAADYRLDQPGPRLVLHDVMRAYLQTRRTTAEHAGVHRRLTSAAADLLPTRDGPAPLPWWLLPTDAGYLWRYLPHHLRQAGQTEVLVELVCDLRWVQAKTARFGSVVLVEADLELVDTPTSTVLRTALRQAAHLLGPIDPPTALGATLASRLHGIPELEPLVDRYRTTLPRPRLEPAWPLPDQPDQPDQASPGDAAGHIGGVTSCAFSPDGALLATTSDDRTIRLWCVPDGTVSAVLSGHTGGVWDCAFSPDGTLLATASDDQTVRLWRISDGTEHAVLRGHTDWVTSCAFSPDGRLLATTSDDHTVRLWHVDDARPGKVMAGHTGRVWGCAFSPDGALLATTGSDQTVRLWRVPDATEHAALTSRVDAGGAWGCAFSPDGTLLAAARDNGTIQLWRVADGTELAALTGHGDRVWGCAFSPDGTLLAGSSYRSVRLWQVATGAQQAVLTGHSSWVLRCKFSPDGTLLATVGTEQTARLWHIGDARQAAVLTSRTGHVISCAFNPDGTLLAVTGEHDARLLHLAGNSQQRTLAGHDGQVNRCAFSPDGTLLVTTGHDSTARLWHAASGATIAVLAGHTAAVRGCAFAPDGRLLATGSHDRTVRLWSADGVQRSLLIGHTGRVNSCGFSPDGTALASASDDRTVRLWSVAAGNELAVLTGHTDFVNDCVFSPDGTLLASTSHDGTVRLWRVADRTQYVVLTGHTNWVERCAFSPDGTLLATASTDGTVRIWRVANGQCHCALRLAGPALGTAWHPGGTMLCTVGGAGIYLLAYLA